MKIDINCDLGEGEPRTRTRMLMRWITSANVACGGHAGDLSTMDACVKFARQFHVRLGAHPGPWSRGDFGRGTVELEPDEMELLLLHQVGALERIARSNGVRLHHVKLHGTLYHATETSVTLRRRYVSTVARWWPGTKIYARAGGGVARLARKLGVPVWEEAFADRGYCDDGSLVPRTQPGALLTYHKEVVARVRTLLENGELTAVSGKRIQLSPDTLCLHSDTPQALELAKTIATAMKNEKCSSLDAQ
jgi:UPF0271 protein